MTAPADLVRRLRLEAPHSEDRALLEQAATVIEGLVPRVITDRKEFWNLPVRSVFLTRWNDGAVIHPILMGDVAFAENALPVTVLWTPDE